MSAPVSTGVLSIFAAGGEGGGGLQFPPVDNLVKWPAWFFQGTPFEFNKITFIDFIAFIVPVALFFIVSRKPQAVPRGLQNLMESSLDFIDKQVIQPAIGPDGLRYMPMLVAMFFYIWIGNVFEIIPTAHMPANARIANPLILAIVTLVMFIGVGVKHHKLGYFKEVLFPPGVPKALYFLVTPIEVLSTFIIRPFSLAVRLFANMLAGHILLVTFSVLCITLWGFQILNVVNLVAFPMLVAFTGFEFMVAFLQAFIFSLLTAVYIGGALHPQH
ncbi:MAG: F0F1 ATP synthase subunit A [Actinobacteria bacterium]|nr:F0F1 ATP synthase subunit A [Actinomycetota bacterium]